jgi:glyoxylase-like metal-dependent hydrolase (beta-lactamase superfamily II)
MRATLTLAAALVLSFSSSRPGGTAGADFDEIRVTDRVLVLRHAPWAETMTVVDAGASLLVIDTWGSLAAATATRMHIEGVFHKSVRYVINTHHHWDHTFGNAAFPGAEIVGHRFCAEDLIAGYGNPVGRKHYFEESASKADTGSVREYILSASKETSDPAFRLAPPTRLTEERYILRAGNLAVHIYHTPGIHTRSNVTIFIPELGVLLGRSEFANPAQLKLETGADPLNIVQVLETVLSSGKPVRHLIPGHGSPIENPDLRASVKRLRSMK